MRINVYSQELPASEDVEFIEKKGLNDKGETETFYGVRMYLMSYEGLHHTADDDDRSAITFWLPKSSHRRQDLASTLYALAQLAEEHAQ